MTDGPANISVPQRLEEGLSRQAACVLNTVTTAPTVCRDNLRTPHTWNLTSLDLFRFSSSGFNCVAPLGTAGSELLKPLKGLWKLLPKYSGVSLWFSSWQEGGQAEEWGSSYSRKGDRRNRWAKFGCCETSSSKKTLRKSLAAPPSCLITQGTVLLQGFPDVGKFTEALEAAVYSVLPRQFDLGFLQFGLGFLPTAPCILTLSL